MKILVIGHSLVVDSNRKFWSVMANTQHADVTLVVPEKWKSNLVNEIAYSFNQEIDHNINNIPLPVHFKGNGSFYFFHILKLYKILCSQKFDAIIVTQETWSLSAFQLGLLKYFSKNRTTLAYLSLCQNLKKKKLSFAHPFERIVTSFYHKLFYCDSSIRDVLAWKKIKNPTAYWPFSYDGDLYEKKITSKPPLLRLGYLGRLSQEKGIQTLLDAFEQIKKEIPSELVIAGNGPLKDKMNTPGIRFLGTIPHNKAHLFYHEIDLFILPSMTMPFWKEQFGRVIIEAVASGKPVIGSNSGAIPEVLSHIGLDTIFQEGNTQSLIEQIKTVWQRMNGSNWEHEFEKFYEKNQRFSHVSVAQKLLEDIKERC